MQIKGFNKIQYSFIKKKTFSKSEIEINVLNLMKDIHRNPTTDITLKDEKQFSTKIRWKASIPLSTPLFNVILKVLPNVRKQENKIKGM